MTSKSEPLAPKAASPRKRPKYDLEMLEKLGQVIAPKQARSEKSFQRILAALESLLADRPLGSISIPEIASKAKCGVAAIYARFTDKHGVVVALHETIRERLRQRIDEEFELERWAEKDVAQFVSEITLIITEFYAGNRYLLAAALLINDATVHERVAQTVVYMSGRFQAVLSARSGRALTVEEVARVELGIRAIVAMLQQGNLFHPVKLSSVGTGSNEEFARDLATIFMACISQVGPAPA